jgi:hypothetical protein
MGLFPGLLLREANRARPQLEISAPPDHNEVPADPPETAR